MATLRKQAAARAAAQIRSLIGQNRLLEAIVNASAIAAPYPKAAEAVKSIESTYRYLLQYLSKGLVDPHRAATKEALEEALREAVDIIELEVDVADNPAKFFEEIRNNRFSRNDNLHFLISEYLRKPDFLRLPDIFSAVWTMFPLDKGTVKLLEETLLRPDADHFLKSQIIGALTLNGLSVFNKNALLLMMRVSDSVDDALQARLIAGILLMTVMHGKRAVSTTELHEAWDAFACRQNLFERIEASMKAIMTACDTDRVSDKIIHEMMPGMMNISPDLQRRMQDIVKNSDPLEITENPEWEELLKKSGMADKIRDLNDMQQSGADVMAASFSNLKGFPFFTSISNWLLPFSEEHPALSSEESFVSLGNMLAGSTLFCNSDKYSLMLSLSGLGEAQKAFLRSQIEQGIEQQSEDDNTSAPVFAKSVFATESSAYMKDLYRLLKQKSKYMGIPNPFTRQISYCDLPDTLAKEISDEVLIAAAEFYFSGRHYAAARKIYTILTEDPLADPYLNEKAGYCAQMAGDLNAALDHYNKAYILNSNSLWLLRSLAATYRKLGQPQKAATFYSEALKLKPDSPKLNLQLANMLLASSNTEEARKAYIKTNYLDNDSPDSRRGLAWCELVLGNYARSRELYESLLLEDGRDSDYLNCGHLALIAGNVSEAIAYYKRFLESNDTSSLFAAMDEDKDVLIKAGIKEDVLFSIADAVLAEE